MFLGIYKIRISHLKASQSLHLFKYSLISGEMLNIALVNVGWGLLTLARSLTALLNAACNPSRAVCADDSDDEKEVSRKRTVRQAASKAVSKQREILLGDGGSEDEEHEDQEEPYNDRTYSRPHTRSHCTLRPFHVRRIGSNQANTLKCYHLTQ